MPISADRRTAAFAQSVTFTEFVESSRNFTADFRANYTAARLSADDRATLEVVDEPVDVLAIVEDWCPDVVANLPILARIADDTGAIQLHVLVRGETTRDIADAYPFEGRSHIPTYVFSDRSGAELGVIVERTPEIRRHVEAFIEEFFAAHPELERATFPAGLGDDLKAELTQSSLRLRRGLRELERSTFVAAIADLSRTAPLSASRAN